MFYGDDVPSSRQVFFSSWEKYRQKQILLPLEQQIVDVILMHPEYQAMLEVSKIEELDTYLSELGDSNPFLHMGLHLAIREQISTDRPPGIRLICTRLLQKYQDQSLVEHRMMDCLAQALWQAQRAQTMPDEQGYLDALKQLT